MKAKENNIAKHYIKRIRPAITCRSSEKHFFLRELNDAVFTYLVDHPEATLETLYAEFGSPEQFANGILTRDDYVKMLKSAETKTKISKLVVITTVAVAVIVIMCLITGAHHGMLTNSGVNYY